MMPASLKLVSPWKANWLPGMLERTHPSNYEMPGSEYATVVQRFAQVHELRVITETRVENVTRSSENKFVVRTNAGTFRAPLLVNASGCFANPFTPAIDGASESSVPQFHFATYGSAARIRNLTGGPAGPTPSPPAEGV